MKRFLMTALLVVMVFTSIIAGEHRTVIISLDGFRWDYTDMYDTPFLDSLAAHGVKAVMQPSFPSVTFPNHYTLATGLVPDHHGIISNRFYDKRTKSTFQLGKNQSNPLFWGGDPIWLTAKRQGKRVGVVYWPGSDVKINGEYPDYWSDYSKKPLLSFVERIAKIEQMLKMPEEQRPQLIMAYFSEPDHSGHTYGPESKQTRKQVETLDCLLGQLWNDIQSMPDADDINLIITSDHGMARLSDERIIHLDKYLDRKWYDRIATGFPSMVFAKKGYEGMIIKALSNVPHLRAYRKSDVPEYLHFGTNENIGEIVVLTDIGFVTSTHDTTISGTHGFDPVYSDMNVIFRAAGPDFRKGYSRKSTFRNVDIYPLLARLLGITPSPCDGNLEEIKDMLAE
ncbi:MAG TPA: alkaline phosphatase family protein [Prevotella sp.]|nr:alkaline phosphatase family protein [Prevotella sp.]